MTYLSLDMEKLQEYDGQGECELVQLIGHAMTMERYRDHFMVWAGNIGWAVVEKKLIMDFNQEEY